MVNAVHGGVRQGVRANHISKMMHTDKNRQEDVGYYITTECKKRQS